MQSTVDDWQEFARMSSASSSRSIESLDRKTLLQDGAKAGSWAKDADYKGLKEFGTKKELMQLLGKDWTNLFRQAEH
eukprot:Skav204344  [mRNA]  locus=scaffold3936:66722:67866:- [translate_table: standard]